MRAVFYFAVWTALARVVSTWSRQLDSGPDRKIERKLRSRRGGGLVLLGLTLTFASVDWAMSLNPHWFSTIWGVMFMVGHVLSALCLMVMLLARLGEEEPLRSVARAGTVHDLGKMMLAFTMLWAYLHLSQFLIIWSGNIAEETPFYLARLHGGWKVLAFILLLAHFVVPFLLLEAEERSRRALGIRERLGDRQGAAIVLGNLGRLFSRTGRYELALRDLGRALEIATELGVKEIERDVWLAFSETHGRMGRHDLALVDHKRNKAFADALLDATTAKRPGIVMVHEWWGITPHIHNEARKFAEQGYTAFIADMYGDAKTADNPKDAGALAGSVMKDAKVMEQRFNAAREQLAKQASVNPQRIGAVGYCFGGAVVLNMARTGADLAAVAGFHATLGLNTPAPAPRTVKAKILILNGADDPFVQREQYDALKKDFDAAKADYRRSWPGRSARRRSKRRSASWPSPTPTWKRPSGSSPSSAASIRGPSRRSRPRPCPGGWPFRGPGIPFRARPA